MEKFDPIEVRQETTAEQRLYMMACLLRLPVVFANARASALRRQDFGRRDEALGALWAAASALADRPENNDSLPAAVKTLLLMELTQIANQGEGLSSSAIDELAKEGGLIDSIFDLPVDQLDANYGSDILVKFLKERRIGSMTKVVFQGLMSNEVLADASAFAQKLASEEAKIDAVRGSADVKLARTTSALYSKFRGGIGIWTTGVTFLDRFMGGGQAPSETYAILGPTGGGKSLLAMQIAVCGANYEIASGRKKHWYYFTYELPVEPLLEARRSSCAASVELTTLLECRPLSVDAATLKPYEIKLFGAGGGPIPTEEQRLDAYYSSGAGDLLHLVDYSGSGPAPGMGTGGIPEIARFLDLETRKGIEIAGVIIDWAGNLIDLYAQPTRGKTEKFEMLNSFTLHVSKQISKRFKCATWCLHQLGAEGMKRAPGSAAHHTDGYGAKGFSFNADYAIQLGVMDQETKCLRVNCTKHRRSEGTAEVCLVQMLGHIQKMVAADGRYGLDPSGRRIIDTDTLNRVGSGPGVLPYPRVTLPPNPNDAASG